MLDCDCECSMPSSLFSAISASCTDEHAETMVQPCDAETMFQPCELYYL
jgi:hypothetical protein